MEKYTPHYDLAVIKADVRRLGRKAFTNTAERTGHEMGLNIEDMQEAIFELQTRMLYKSMTTYEDHRVWQDVYHQFTRSGDLYKGDVPPCRRPTRNLL